MEGDEKHLQPNYEIAKKDGNPNIDWKDKSEVSLDSVMVIVRTFPEVWLQKHIAQLQVRRLL